MSSNAAGSSLKTEREYPQCQHLPGHCSTVLVNFDMCPVPLSLTKVYFDFPSQPSDCVGCVQDCLFQERTQGGETQTHLSPGRSSSASFPPSHPLPPLTLAKQYHPAQRMFSFGGYLSSEEMRALGDTLVFLYLT